MIQVEMEFLNYYVSKLIRKEVPQCQKKNYILEQKIIILRDLFEKNMPISQVAENTMFM